MKTTSTILINVLLFALIAVTVSADYRWSNGYDGYRSYTDSKYYVREGYGTGMVSRTSVPYVRDGYGTSYVAGNSYSYARDSYGSSWENKAGIRDAVYVRDGYGTSYSSSGERWTDRTWVKAGRVVCDGCDDRYNSRYRYDNDYYDDYRNDRYSDRRSSGSRYYDSPSYAYTYHYTPVYNDYPGDDDHDYYVKAQKVKQIRKHYQ